MKWIVFFFYISFHLLINSSSFSFNDSFCKRPFVLFVFLHWNSYKKTIEFIKFYHEILANDMTIRRLRLLFVVKSKQFVEMKPIVFFFPWEYSNSTKIHVLCVCVSHKFVRNDFPFEFCCFIFFIQLFSIKWFWLFSL